MKVDCYNACEVEFSDIEFGDAFYWQSQLYIKAHDITSHDAFRGVCVDLSTGYLASISFEEKVIKADAKVVAVNPIE